MKISPAKVLEEIQMMLVGELVAQPSAIVLSRQIVSILQAALGDIAGQVDALAEGAAAADRLATELRIALAARDAAEAKLRLITAAPAQWARLQDPHSPAWDMSGSTRKGELDTSARRRCKIVDLSEAMSRERRDAGRPVPPSDGGAA